ncbi:MAG: MarR family transcriptional regulator [Candidatus Aenigmarchaeota archaeon]|nr:MarR family transcriptional regulator [Candidatus Aenigmarchaeota archaeon]
MKPLTNTKYIGIVIVLIAIVLFLYVSWLTLHLMKVNAVIHLSCNLPEAICPYSGFPEQGIVGYSFSAIILIFGLYLISVSRLSDRINTENIDKFRKTIDSLNGDEKTVYEVVVEANAIFQSELVEKLQMNKVKVSRIIDKLEGRGLLERKRRGMSNVLVPKRGD